MDPTDTIIVVSSLMVVVLAGIALMIWRIVVLMGKDELIIDDGLRGMTGVINVHLCPNSNISLCPEHLQQMIAVIQICSLVDDEDLTNKIMRSNFDQAILRETVINHSLQNGKITTGNATNTIV